MSWENKGNNTHRIISQKEHRTKNILCTRPKADSAKNLCVSCTIFIGGQMINDILKEAEAKMADAILRLKEELKKVRTGRAHSGIVEDVKVSYYGLETSLRELASITAPEANLIQIKPFDRNSIGDVETAIRNADLGFNPTNDGNFVRITLPPMTEERRIELAKQIKKYGEESKISMRTIRGDAWSRVQKGEKTGDVTEDDRYQAEEKLNKLIEKMNQNVEQVVAEKEKEVMKI